MTNKPQTVVSVIVPIRNEEEYIGKLLECLQSQIMDNISVEIIIVDGMSTDNTRKIVSDYIKKNSNIILLDNHELYVPYAMNLGINNSKGDIIIRMDAHSIYPNDYIQNLVYWSIELDAENVGCALQTLPANGTKSALAIAECMGHPFGVGTSVFRINKPDSPILVDTVPFGCFPRSLFEKIGTYDEDLVRNQDDEFNGRIILNDGKIFLVPGSVINYYGRSTFKSLLIMFYQYGLFKPLVNIKLGRPSTVRQFAPVLFVLALCTLPIFLLAKSTLVFPVFFAISVYILLNFGFSLVISINVKAISVLIYSIFSFFIMHFGYGFGYIRGIIKYIFLKKHKRETGNFRLSR